MGGKGVPQYHFFKEDDDEDSYCDNDNSEDDDGHNYDSEERLVEHAAVLGVNPSASEHDVKKAYRKSARRFHPDKWKDRKSADGMDRAQATEHFKRINSAYEYLSVRAAGAGE